jgi:hypothetical protein
LLKITAFGVEGAFIGLSGSGLVLQLTITVAKTVCTLHDCRKNSSRMEVADKYLAE